MARRSPRTVTRSARTGRFVTKGYARRAPSKTMSERVGAGTGNSRTVYRSATTGRFVKATTATRSPSTTVVQRV
jgi:hypothetical protein